MVVLLLQDSTQSHGRKKTLRKAGQTMGEKKPCTRQGFKGLAGLLSGFGFGRGYSFTLDPYALYLF